MTARYNAVPGAQRTPWVDHGNLGGILPFQLKARGMKMGPHYTGLCEMLINDTIAIKGEFVEGKN